MDDRWPYPISQAMQRQTGNRVKPLRVPGTPPTAPEADTDGKTDKTEPAAPCQIVPRPQD